VPFLLQLFSSREEKGALLGFFTCTPRGATPSESRVPPSGSFKDFRVVWPERTFLSLRWLLGGAATLPSLGERTLLLPSLRGQRASLPVSPRGLSFF